MVQERIKWYLTLGVFVGLFLYAWQNRLDTVSAIINGEIRGESRFLVYDAAEYYQLALKTPFPCFSTRRPPFFLCLGRSWLHVFGDLHAGTLQEVAQEKARLSPAELSQRLLRVLSNELAMRRLNVATSQCALLALFSLTLLLAGRFAALCAAFLWTFSTWDIRYSTSFLREDLLVFLNLILVLIFVLLIRNPTNKSTWFASTVLLIAVGSAASLTNLAYFITILGMVLVYNLVKGLGRAWSRRDMAVSVAVYAGILAVALPYLVFNYREVGAFFAPLHNHARFWRNHEFAGQPGYPTRQEVIEGSRLGAPITTFEYVFEKHSLLEVGRRYLQGYRYALGRYLPRLFNFIPPLELLRYALWLTLPGLVACHLLGREGYFLLFASLITLFPNAFILPLNVVLTKDAPAFGPGVEPRFTFPLLSFAMILCGLGAEKVREMIARWFIDAGYFRRPRTTVETASRPIDR